jgi:hypothetical protein
MALKLKKIKVRDLLDSVTYWVKSDRMVAEGIQIKNLYKDRLDEELEVYAFPVQD